MLHDSRADIYQVDNLHPKALTLLRSHLPQASSTSTTSTAKPIRSPGDIHRNLSSFTAQATKSKGKDQDPTILELHGTLAKVHCLKARHERARDEYQEELADRNPVWQEMAEEAERTGVRPRTNPDGDVSV
jgi:NAD-dependent SIR2 family protein deacetylase